MTFDVTQIRIRMEGGEVRNEWWKERKKERDIGNEDIESG
jgi:hypothetical protein